MGIESPISYGDYYWASQLESSKLMDEQTESALAPYFGGLLSAIPDIGQLPAGIQNLLTALAEPPSAGLGGFAALSAGEFASETIRDLVKPGMSMAIRSINRGALETWLTAAQAVTLFQRKKIDDSYFELLVTSEGYDPLIARDLSTSMLPYPAIADLMRYGRYHGDPQNTRDVVWSKFDVPADDFDMYEWLTLPQLSIEQVHTLFRREKITEADVNYLLAQIGWRDPNIGHVSELGWTIPNPMLLTQANLQAEASPEEVLKDISRGDIHPDRAQQYLDAILTKPATQDIVAHELRINPDLSDLDRRLRKIGIHPEYLEVYRDLAQVIPPVADIITMAVREAFSPAIAARFGQYEDFPDELGEWGAKKGLSLDWSKRYWAAHWSLPSVSQGFEMLHRGVITSEDLNMLLRAQDVMPFWRDKLTAIAFRTLTRVDVRRMYKEGVLDEAGVYKAYLDAGYADENADRMTEFTIRQTLSVQAKFTSADVIKAYTTRMISASEARGMLLDLGIRSTDASYILETAEYKRLWDLTNSRIAGIKNLYRKGVYDENAARAKLLGLNLPAVEVDVLFEQWWFEKAGDLAPTWTKAETLRYAAEGRITVDRARVELERMGYDAEHVNIYVGAIKWPDQTT